MSTKQMPIANIARVDIITEETTPRVMSFDTASEATAEAQVSSGNEQELRIKNRILAQNNTEDIVKGYNVSLTDSTFSPEVFAYIDGGESTLTTGGDFSSYIAPIAGENVNRTKSQLAVYSEEKDYDGNVLSYTAFIFPHAYGSPASVSFKDGEFYAPSYTMKSRPSKGSSPMTVLCMPTLPVIVQSDEDLPESPVSDKTVILVAGKIASQPDLSAGTFAVYRDTAYKAI